MAILSVELVGPAAFRAPLAVDMRGEETDNVPDVVPGVKRVVRPRGADYSGGELSTSALKVFGSFFLRTSPTRAALDD